MSNREMAECLEPFPMTIDSHIRHIYDKAGRQLAHAGAGDVRASMACCADPSAGLPGFARVSRHANGLAGHGGGRALGLAGRAPARIRRRSRCSSNRTARPGHDGVVWYRLRWDIAGAPQTLGLYMHYVMSAGAISVNGVELDRDESSVEPLSRAGTGRASCCCPLRSCTPAATSC